MSDTLQIIAGDQTLRDIPLDKPRLTIGRDDDCAIQVADSALAGKHGAIERRDGGGWSVRTFDPSRPIQHEGALHTSVRLESGTVFTLGQTQMRFISGTRASQAPAVPAPQLPASVPTGPSASPAVPIPAAAPPAAEQAAPVRAPVPVPAVVQPQLSSVPHPRSHSPLQGVMPQPSSDPTIAVGELAQAHARILEQAERCVIGQRKVLEQILVALFAQGHCLLIGVPGLAKTLIVRVLAGTLDLSNKRVQFTPDLMPADITGTDILEEDAHGARHFRFKQGPIFANLVLADEINRTPPKTQAALLEAMQERQVTAAGTSYDLPKPFFVLATQNPIEQEGTYPLPEAQLDRFMFCIKLDYPNAADEQRILLETTRDSAWQVEKVLGAQAILRFQQLVRQVPVSPHVAQYATDLIRATRPGEGNEWVKQFVRWGAGTRAGQFLLLAAKAHALLAGRTTVSCADVRSFAPAVLRHRICCTFAAGAEGIDADAVIQRIVSQVKEPSYEKA